MLSEHIVIQMDNAEGDFFFNILKSFHLNFHPENGFAFLFRASARQVYDKYAPKFYAKYHYSDTGLRLKLSEVEAYGLLNVFELLLENSIEDPWKYQFARATYEKLDSQVSKFNKPLINYGN